MKKIMLMSALLLMAITMTAQEKQTETMTKEKGGIYVIRTEKICDTRGYRGTTPLEVYIKKKKIEKVVALKNHETPRFFSSVLDTMLPAYAGKGIDEWESVDGVTGATFSSKAVKDNVKAAVEYYKKNK